MLFTPGPEEAQVRGKDELFCRKPALTCALEAAVHSIYSNLLLRIRFCFVWDYNKRKLDIIIASN